MINATQGKDLSLAGLMFSYSGFKILAKLSFQFADVGNYFPHIAGEMNCIAASDSRAAWTFATSTRELHHTCSNEFSESIKKGLMFDYIQVYGYRAPAKSGARIGVLITCIVPTRTKRVFLSAKFLHTQFMVGWMRLPKGRPVSIQAGYANLVQLTTSLRLASLGGELTIHCIEAAIMATTPTQNPQFIWIIAAVRRDIPTIKAQIHHITAHSEREARRSLVRNHVCFFAGRIHLEVAHA